MSLRLPKIKFYITVIIVCNYSIINSQCVSSGSHDPGTIANSNIIGSLAWSSVANSSASDDSRSTATSAIPTTSNYIVATNFGFSIPLTATVCGISVEIEKSGSGVAHSITDNSVLIVKGGSVSGSNKAVGGDWSGTDAYSSYGGASDAWGETWIPTDINSASFGIALSANISGVTLPTARIDHIRITVSYENTVLPIELNYFDAQRINNESVALNWSTLSEINNEKMIIERSTDHFNWEERGNISGHGNSNTNQNYSFTDVNNLGSDTYYRIKQIDVDGSYSYSEVTQVSPVKSVHHFMVHLSSPTLENYIEMNTNSTPSEIIIYTINGALISSKSILNESSSTEALFNLKSGIYLLKVIDKEGNAYSKKVVL